MPGSVINLLVVDDDPLVLEALGHYFASADDMKVGATAENGKAALALLGEQDFDVIVADIHMPEMDGTTLLREVGEMDNPPVFIAMTAMDNDDTLLDVMSHKAAAYILKSSKPAYILETVREAVKGGTVVTPQSLTRLVEHLPELQNTTTMRPTAALDSHDIPPAQLRVLELLCEGQSNAEIAASTGYADGTIKKYISYLLAEFQAKSRLDLAIKALKAGYGQ